MPPSCSGRVERTVPSVRRQSGQAKTSSVGRFGTCAMPSTVSMPPPVQRAPGSRPTVRSVPGPLKRIASNARASSCSQRARSRGGVLAPRLHGVGVVEADGMSDGFPEPLDVGLAEDLLRLALGRERGDRPVRPCARSGRAAARCIASTGRALPTRAWSRSASSSGSGSPRDHDQRAAAAIASARASSQGGDSVRLVLGRRLDERAADVVVGVADVDEAGAGAVAGAGERAGERGMLDERGHEEGLARLHVGADPDDQVGVAIDAFHAGDNRDSNIRCRGGRRPTTRRAPHSQFSAWWRSSAIEWASACCSGARWR